MFRSEEKKILATCIWLGEKYDQKYMESIGIFMSQHKHLPGLSLRIYYSSSYSNLPEKFETIFLKTKEAMANSSSILVRDYKLHHGDEDEDEGEDEVTSDIDQYHKLFSIDYNFIKEKIEFIDIEKLYKHNRYITFLGEYEPIPFAFISDYLRFLIMYQVSQEFENQNIAICYFESDLLFNNKIPEDFLSGKNSNIFVSDVNANGEAVIYSFMMINNPSQITTSVYKKISELYELECQSLLSILPILQEAPTNKYLEIFTENFNQTSNWYFGHESDFENTKFFDDVASRRAFRGFTVFFYGTMQGLPSRIFLAYSQNQLPTEKCLIGINVNEFALHCSSNKSGKTSNFSRQKLTTEDKFAIIDSISPAQLSFNSGNSFKDYYDKMMNDYCKDDAKVTTILAKFISVEPKFEYEQKFIYEFIKALNRHNAIDKFSSVILLLCSLLDEEYSDKVLSLLERPENHSFGLWAKKAKEVTYTSPTGEMSADGFAADFYVKAKQRRLQ